jgi:hypothetical protein
LLAGGMVAIAVVADEQPPIFLCACDPRAVVVGLDLEPFRCGYPPLTGGRPG